MYKLKIYDQKEPRQKIQILLSLLSNNLVLIEFRKKDKTLRKLYTYATKELFDSYMKRLYEHKNLEPKNLNFKFLDLKLQEYRTVKLDSIESVTVIPGILDRGNALSLIEGMDK